MAYHAKRVKPGDGQPLPPYRWWQLLNRSVMFLQLTEPAGVVTYAVDVRIAGDRDDGEVRARLYRDGIQVAVSKVPARFVVGVGAIEVKASMFGLRRCHYVAADGTETQLTPHPQSGEGRRARFDRNHPAASRVMGLISIVLVLVGVTLTLLQALEGITGIPVVNDITGTFVSPVHLPGWTNIAVLLIIAAASVERALRMRSSWLDSLAG